MSLRRIEKLTADTSPMCHMGQPIPGSVPLCTTLPFHSLLQPCAPRHIWNLVGQPCSSKIISPRGGTTSHSYFQQNIKQQEWPPTLQKNPGHTELRLTISSIVSARKQSTSRSTKEMVKKTPPPTAQRPSTLL